MATIPMSSWATTTPNHNEPVDLPRGFDHARYARDNTKVGQALDDSAKMSTRRVMTFVAMAFLFTGSQIPIYLLGAVAPYIYRDIGGADRWTWMILAKLIALAAVCPFVASISDMLGRRWVAIIGALLIMLGVTVASTARTMNTLICGMAFTGIGSGLNELTALAVTSEMAPTAKRGKYVAILIFTILPFCPSLLWGQLIAYHSSWRYCGLLSGVWIFIGLILTVIFYHPPPRTTSAQLGERVILRRTDYMGGVLSISGVTLFMMALHWAKYQYSWPSGHVIVPLILGIFLCIMFVAWETTARHPMFPPNFTKNKRIFGWTMVIITCMSGANFVSILMLWPSQSFQMYGHDPIGAGIRGLPVGFGLLAGSFLALWALSKFGGHNRTILLVSSVLMTAGCAAMSIARPDNMHQLWGILVVASLGIGGIVVPASIISTIVSADEHIATVTALTLSIRVLGGSIGYCAYFNILSSHFVPAAKKHIAVTLLRGGVYNLTTIRQAIEMIASSKLEEIALLPGIAGNDALYEAVITGGKLVWMESYRVVYYATLVPGVISCLASCFLGDVGKYMDEHVAVTM